VSFIRDGFRYNNFSRIIARKSDDAYMYAQIRALRYEQTPIIIIIIIII
jgi:hypothetical protein